MSQHVVKQLQARFPDAVVEITGFRGDELVVVARDRIVEVCRWLKETPGCAFNFLMDLCGVDYLLQGLASPPRLAKPVGSPPQRRTCGCGDPGRPERFEVVYHLYSLTTGKRVRLKVRVSAEDPVVASVSGVWVTTDWFERECFDLFGIRFSGHENLRRLLTYEEFEGHALRKDYPRNQRQKIPTPDPLIQ